MTGSPATVLTVLRLWRVSADKPQKEKAVKESVTVTYSDTVIVSDKTNKSDNTSGTTT